MFDGRFRLTAAALPFCEPGSSRFESRSTVAVLPFMRTRPNEIWLRQAHSLTFKAFLRAYALLRARSRLSVKLHLTTDLFRASSSCHLVTYCGSLHSPRGQITSLKTLNFFTDF